MAALLTYAHNENGKLVHIDDVENGGRCKCVCPHCKKSLNAKNGGKKREHHFAHANGNTCENAYETTLHLLAKEVLMEECAVMLPNEGPKGFPRGPVRLHDMKSEQWDEQYKFKPDIEGITEDGERLLIEIYVSHKITSKKRKTIIDNNLRCVEIDLNWVKMDKGAIRKYLTEKRGFREWVMPQEENRSEKGGGYSLYLRNPLHLKIIEHIKDSFNKGELSLEFRNRTFNLRKYKYDVCEQVPQKYRGMKADLLLYRSSKDDDGCICICVRGRRRNFNQQVPPDLRIIDIIIRSSISNSNMLDSNIISEYENNVETHGFKLPDYY